MTQTEALDILKMGYNVYLTGAAGSGKTYLLNQYINFLKSHSVSVGITASTGIAATHMGGTTIHSWSGMGIREEMTEGEIRELFRRPYLRKRFKHTRVLIIDEISMLHAHQLDLVNFICKTVKGVGYPFGGMQIIMCGDLFQLPPVSKIKREEAPQGRMTFGDAEGTDFVTQSQVWQEMELKICYLDEQFRQDDRALLRVLNDIRNNDVNESTVEYLQERMHKDITGFAKPTRLFTHNADVDTINAKHLDALPGVAHEFFMTSRGSPGISEVLKKSCLAPSRLVLKVGAQVMFVKNNFDEHYVNGTLGEVIGFSENGAPIVRTFDGYEVTVSQASWEVKEDSLELAAISQLPLRLAWAITVHKSQGMSLDAAEIDLSRSFVPGMGYVALSRVRSLSGLKLLGMNQVALTVHEGVAEMDKFFRRRSDEASLHVHTMDSEKKLKMQVDFLEFLKAT